MQRYPCPHLPQDSSSAPLHKCPRSMASSGMTSSSPPWHSPWIPHPGWESLTFPPHRAQLIRGKHGVEIVSDYDQGNGNIRFPVVPGEPRTVTVLVQNGGTEVVTLQQFQTRQQAQELSFTDEQGAVQGQSLLLHPGRAPSHPLPHALPRREDAGPSLTTSPRRWHVPHPGAVPHHLQWALQCCGVLRVHQGARRALQHLTLRCCRCREPAGQGPGALGTFPALRGQPPAPSHGHHRGWHPPRQVRGEVTCCHPEQRGPACSPARTSSLTVWHHRTDSASTMCDGW